MMLNFIVKKSTQREEVVVGGSYHIWDGCLIIEEGIEGPPVKVYSAGSWHSVDVEKVDKKEGDDGK